MVRYGFKFKSLVLANCIRGEKEEKLKEPLTQEEKELVKEFREEVEEYRKAGMEDFLYAIDFDLE